MPEARQPLTYNKFTDLMQDEHTDSEFYKNAAKRYRDIGNYIFANKFERMSKDEARHLELLKRLLFKTFMGKQVPKITLMHKVTGDDVLSKEEFYRQISGEAKASVEYKAIASKYAVLESGQLAATTFNKMSEDESRHEEYLNDMVKRPAFIASNFENKWVKKAIKNLVGYENSKDLYEAVAWRIEWADNNRDSWIESKGEDRGDSYHADILDEVEEGLQELHDAFPKLKKLFDEDKI